MSTAVATSMASPEEAARLVRATLREFGAVRFAVRGDCMRPALVEGEDVLVVAAARQPPRFGDVVLLESSEGLRLHRLVWNGRRLRTKGDRAPGFDGPRPWEAALGTVVGVQRAQALVPTRSRTRAAWSVLRGLVSRAVRAGLRLRGRLPA